MNVGRYLRGDHLHVGTSRITKSKEPKMNHRIEQLAAEAKIMTEESINMKISFNTQLKAFSENFVKLMLEECAKTIKHESLVQLDPDFGIIYSRAIVDRFGFTLHQPFLTVTLKD